MSGHPIHNCLKNRLGVLQNINIPEANHLDTLAFQILAPDSVVIPPVFGIVLTAVNFNCDFLQATEEIQDVRADAVLPDEFQAQKALTSKVTPQSSFGVGLVDS